MAILRASRQERSYRAIEASPSSGRHTIYHRYALINGASRLFATRLSMPQSCLFHPSIPLNLCRNRPRLRVLKRRWQIAGRLAALQPRKVATMQGSAYAGDGAQARRDLASVFREILGAA